MKYSISIFINLFLIGSLLGQSENCDCYSVTNVEITTQDTLALTLYNSCDNNVYLNLFLISSLPPFDTLARQDYYNAYFPLDTNYTEYLLTELEELPEFGTYRISIENGTLICDSLKFGFNHTSVNKSLRGKSMFIYPNPVDRYITINSHKEISFIRLFGILGNTYQLKNYNNKIDLGQLKSGLYIVEFYDVKMNLIDKQKVIKN